ncbi:MAG: hypothetical protein A2X23_03975 [Chloroflexi bacterium GWC2_73_18]|nr:MAG: hypothetical protein A2X23_03975 [Chloroflexi bacterium GWC2_73_18]
MTRILVVARWYPAHDDPVRGVFVADQVGALLGAGVEAVVASFENHYLSREARQRAAEERAYRGAMALALARPDAAVVPPPGSGLPPAPVARLPVMIPAPREPLTEGSTHAEALAAFAVAAHSRRPFDLLHAHTGYPDGAAAAAAAGRLGVPYAITEHSRGLDAIFADEALRARYAAAAAGGRLLAVSGPLADRIRAALPGIELEVVPNAVPLAGFPFRDAAQRESAELLFVGSRRATTGVDSKGIDVLFEAFALVRRGAAAAGRPRPDLALRLVGGARPEDDAAWRALAGRLGIGDAVRLEPAARRDEVAAAMARATLFVHASPWETFGVVVAEALATGLPVVTTRSGGPEEILGATRSEGPESLPGGELAPRNDPPALAEAIERALGRVERAGFDRAAMRRDALARFDAAAVAVQLRAIYAEMTGRGAGS